MPNKKFVFVDKPGDYRWQRFSPNGREVGNSGEGFKTKQGVVHNAQLNGYQGDGIKGWTKKKP